MSNQSSTSSTSQAAHELPEYRSALGDIETALKKLRGIPPAKWLLVAPTGEVWAQSDPAKLIQVLSVSAYKSFHAKHAIPANPRPI